MMKSNLLKGFTLVEMLIGVALSTILMISISIFVTNGIKNVTIQKKVLDNIEQNLDFFTETQGIMKRISGSGTVIGSGVLFPIDTQYDNGAYAYIGVKSYSGTICKDTDGEELEGDEFVTNHIYLKKFFPYEGLRTSNGYYTSTGSHFVKDSSGNIIIGKEIFGDKLENGDKGVDVYLNTPTGIASFGSKVFISDTLNNRILFYNASSGFENIFTILDSSDGILMPSGLAYDDSNKTLYIANTGKGEILKYTWGNSGKDLNIDFKIPKNISNIKKIELYFMPGITSITNPNGSETFKIDGFNKNSGDYFFSGSTNIAEYYFSDFGKTEATDGPKNISSCNYDEDLYIEGGIIKKDITTCSTSNTGTITKKSSLSYQDISKKDNISLDINNITGSNFTSTGSYYINMRIVGDTYFEEYFPLFTIGDGKILTKDDNTLSLLIDGFYYPTGLDLSGTDHLMINDFIDRKKYKINLSDLVQTEDSDLLDYDYETINNVHDYLLDVPVEDMKISNTDGMLTIVVRYYKKYHCVNPGERALRTMIFKKNLK